MLELARLARKGKCFLHHPGKCGSVRRWRRSCSPPSAPQIGHQAGAVEDERARRLEGLSVRRHGPPERGRSARGVTQLLEGLQRAGRRWSARPAGRGPDNRIGQRMWVKGRTPATGAHRIAPGHPGSRVVKPSALRLFSQKAGSGQQAQCFRRRRSEETVVMISAGSCRRRRLTHDDVARLFQQLCSRLRGCSARWLAATPFPDCHARVVAPDHRLRTHRAVGPRARPGLSLASRDGTRAPLALPLWQPRSYACLMPDRHRGPHGIPRVQLDEVRRIGFSERAGRVVGAVGRRVGMGMDCWAQRSLRTAS